MGLCESCFDCSEADQPSPETQRRQQAEAAERRKKDLEGRGVKNPEALKRKQEQQRELEKRTKQNQATGDAGLKWQVG